MQPTRGIHMVGRQCVDTVEFLCKSHPWDKAKGSLYT